MTRKRIENTNISIKKFVSNCESGTELVEIVRRKTIWLKLKCGICGEEYETQWGTFRTKKCLHVCQKCSRIINGKREAQTKASRNPMPRDLEVKLNQMWDWSENESVPSDYSLYSNKTVSFVCPICGYKWKQALSVVVRSLQAGNNGCASCCGKVVTTYYALSNRRPDLIKYFANPKDADAVREYSVKEVLLRCPVCHRTKLGTVRDLTNRGFSCDVCGVGRSYPERYLYNFFELTHIAFETQKTFPWSCVVKDNGKISKKYYDFFLPQFNLAVEAHGKQHYSDKVTFDSADENWFEKEVLNDILKKELCEDNGLVYLEIDCMISSAEYIKKSIIKSGLLERLNIELENIPWETISSLADNNVLTWKIATLFNEKKTIQEIAEEVKMDVTSVVHYLHKATNVGLCEYNREKVAKKGPAISGLQCSKIVYCIEDDKLYKSLAAAAKQIGVAQCTITSACSGRQKTVKKKHYIFGEEAIKQNMISRERYIDFYEKNITNEIVRYKTHDF